MEVGDTVTMVNTSGTPTQPTQAAHCDAGLSAESISKQSKSVRTLPVHFICVSMRAMRHGRGHGDTGVHGFPCWLQKFDSLGKNDGRCQNAKEFGRKNHLVNVDVAIYEKIHHVGKSRELDGHGFNSNCESLTGGSHPIQPVLLLKNPVKNHHGLPW